MPGPVWEDNLISKKNSEGQYDKVLRVVNSPLLEMPNTGSVSLMLIPVDAAICMMICIGCLFLLRKEKKEH